MTSSAPLRVLLADDHAVVRKGIRAVSYTHLRAHETVLDLVCRLLLEKKTTYTLTTNHTASVINIPLEHSSNLNCSIEHNSRIRL